MKLLSYSAWKRGKNLFHSSYFVAKLFFLITEHTSPVDKGDHHMWKLWLNGTKRPRTSKWEKNTDVYVSSFTCLQHSCSAKDKKFELEFVGPLTRAKQISLLN